MARPMRRAGGSLVRRLGASFVGGAGAGGELGDGDERERLREGVVGRRLGGSLNDGDGQIKIQTPVINLLANISSE